MIATQNIIEITKQSVCFPRPKLTGLRLTGDIAPIRPPIMVTFYHPV